MAGRGWRIGVLVGLAVAVLGGLGLTPRLPQALAYHQFADQRALLGIPNGLDVLSSAAFAAVGLAGLRLLGRSAVALRDARERWPWLVFFAGVTLTSLGSAWYHLAPSNERLVWDRLPMAVAFMALLAALIGERIDPGAGLRLLGPLVALGLGSVLAWHLSEQAGAGDLRPYAFVQCYSILAVPAVPLLFPRGYTMRSAYLWALAAYLLAKALELEDLEVFRLGGAVSGHTLKHLLAAAGIGALAWMLARRQSRAG
jgi:hypothetical protein